jgi:hypothetical protein
LHHPLLCFALAFGARPSRSSPGCELVLPCGRPSLRRLLAKPSTPEHTSLACGSLRRLPMPTYAAASCRLATARRPTGVASPGSTRRLHLPAVFHAGSSMGTSPFRGFSPFAPSWPHAACRNRPPATRTILLVVSHLAPSACGEADFRYAMPRLRGFKLDRHDSPRRSCPRHGSPLAIRTDAFSGDGVVHAPDGSLLSWLLPPFEADLPASSHTSAGLLSWASIVHARPPIASRLRTGPHARALFRVSENRKYWPARASRPPWGSCLGAPAP